MLFRTGDRIEPTEENDFLTSGTVMEDVENDTSSNRPNAVYVKLDGEFYPRYLDAMLFKREKMNDSG